MDRIEESSGEEGEGRAEHEAFREEFAEALETLIRRGLVLDLGGDRYALNPRVWGTMRLLRQPGTGGRTEPGSHRRHRRSGRP